MTPEQLRQTRAYTPPPMDYDDPYPGDFPTRPRFRASVMLAALAGLALAAAVVGPFVWWRL